MLYMLIILFGIAGIGVLGRSFYENSHFIRKRYCFSHENIDHPVKLLFLSDLHNNTFGRENEHLIRAIREEQPDVILIGGDLIVGKGGRVNTNHALSFVNQIQDICPVLYTYGNHETRVKDTKEFQNYQRELKKQRIELLNNTGIHMQIHGQKFFFYGLELSNEQYKKEQISRKNPFRGIKGEIKVLIAHTPNFFETYAKWNPDYVFSGHNHGGIVRLPHIGGMISTEHKLLPKYSYGVYQRKATSMILSAGAGTHTIKFRLFNPSEIVLAELQEKEKGQE